MWWEIVGWLRCKGASRLQLAGGLLAFVLVKLLYPGITKSEAADIIEPHLWSSSDLETH